MPPEVNSKKSQFKPVALVWVDAAFDPEHDDCLFPIPAVTFGVIWEKTKDYIKVASEVFANGTARSFTTVPRGGMNPRIIPLDRLEVPEVFIEYQKKLLPLLSL